MYNRGPGRIIRVRNPGGTLGLAGTIDDSCQKAARSLRKIAIVVMKITVDLD